MVYSTCTLNEEENENVLKWALENLDLKLLDINLKLKEAEIALNKAIRVLPSKETEGFFVAKMIKKS